MILDLNQVPLGKKEAKKSEGFPTTNRDSKQFPHNSSRLSPLFPTDSQTQSPPGKVLRMWFSILVEFDEYGNAVVLRSFSNPAKESDLKKMKKVGKVKRKKAKVKKVKVKKVEEY